MAERPELVISNERKFTDFREEAPAFRVKNTPVKPVPRNLGTSPEAVKAEAALVKQRALALKLINE